MDGLRFRDDAVSPVVAVILLVAITVALSAVVGSFALDLGQQTTNSQQSSIGVKTSVSDGSVTATVVTGEADEVRLLVNGSVVDTAPNASAGDILTGAVTPDSDVTVVSVTDGTASVVSTVNPTASSTASSGPTAPTAGLIAHWKFEEGSGGTTADSAGSHDGTLVNETKWTTTSKTGSYALTYDGVDDYVSAPEATPSNFTLSAWVKTTDNGTIIDRAPNPSSGEIEGWRIWVLSDGTVKTAVGDGSGGCSLWCAELTGSTSVTDGKWHHVASTYESGTLKLYVDSTRENMTSSAGLGYSVSRDVYFATTSYAGDVLTNEDTWMLDGTIDDGRIYNRSLNQSEINDLYNATK